MDGAPYTLADACDDIIKLLNAINSYNSGNNKDQYALFGTTNSNAFTFTLLVDIGLCNATTGKCTIGGPTGLAPGWGQIISGLLVQ
jgi:hypothetical protein